MNFLVMEDYFPLRSELEDLIEALGHTAFGANNATEASKLTQNGLAPIRMAATMTVR